MRREIYSIIVLFLLISGMTSLFSWHEVKASETVTPAKKENAKASNKRFEACRQKLKKAQKLDVLYNLEYKTSGIPKVTVGPTFFKMPIDGKQGFAETVNCFFVVGATDKYINFDILDWRSGKRVGRFSYGKVKMD